MDHDYIKQFDVIDRYLRGMLVPEESEQFEEHFIDCPECVDNIKTTRAIKHGLRILTVEQASKEKVFDLTESSWFSLQNLFKNTWVLVACGLLLIATVMLIFLVSQNHGLRLETDQAKKAAAESQRRYEEQEQFISSSEQEHLKTVQGLRGQVQELESELQDAQNQHDNPADASPGLMQPGINFPIFVLSSIRESVQNPSDVNEINLSRSMTGFVISIPLEGEAKYKIYRVTIFANNRRFWGSSGLKPDRDNALTISFNSNFFPPGEYMLQVAGIPSERGSEILGNYYFRINKRP